MMKNISSLGRLAGLGAIAMIAVVGCGGGNSNNDAAVETAGSVDATVNAAGRAVDGAADTAGNAMSGAGNTIAGAGKSVAGAAKNLDDAATITPAVKTAIGNNAAMKGTKIDVDTTDTTVTLSGTVKNQAQKAAAGSVAKKNAPGYKIANNLKVVK